MAQRLREPGFDSDSWCLTGAHKTPASDDMMAPTSIALTCVTLVPVYKQITENKNAINVKSHSLRQKVECSGAGGWTKHRRKWTAGTHGPCQALFVVIVYALPVFL